MSINGKLKSKKCRHCKQSFTPWNSLQVVCSPLCALELVRANGDKLVDRAIKRQQKVQRMALRERKQALKSKSDWLREAQAVFNKFIRLRDEHLGVCISCQKPPKKKNAGHYKSRGAFPELRFNEDNCHLQCEHCNSFKSGNQVEYRINLIKKIGAERVEILEGNNEAKKYDIEQIKEIKQKYAQKCRELSRD